MIGPEGNKPRPVAYLAYQDIEGMYHYPGEDEGMDQEEFIQQFRNSPDDDSFSTVYPIVKLACLYSGANASYVSGINKYENGLCPPVVHQTIQIPEDAVGLAYLVFDGVNIVAFAAIARRIDDQVGDTLQ